MDTNTYTNSLIAGQNKDISKADFDLFLNSVFALSENDVSTSEIMKNYGLSRILAYSWMEPQRPDVDSLWRYSFIKFLLRYDKNKQEQLYKTLYEAKILEKPHTDISEKMLSTILKAPLGVIENIRNDNNGWQKKFYNIIKRQHPKVLYFQFYYIRHFLWKNIHYPPLIAEYKEIEEK